MTAKIKVGDRVQWKERGAYGKPISGVVTKVYATVAVVKVGADRWRYPDIKRLRRVEGEGGGDSMTKKTCAKCQGVGTVIMTDDSRKLCSVCKGKGTVEE